MNTRHTITALTLATLAGIAGAHDEPERESISELEATCPYASTVEGWDTAHAVMRPAVHVAVLEQDGSTRSTETSVVSTTTITSGAGHTVSVRLFEDGTYKVTHNGVEVPSDRVEVLGNRVRVLDEDGEVIQIVRMGGMPNVQVAGVPLAARTIGRTDRPMLGITYDSPDNVLRQQLGLGEGEGVVVLSTIEGLPAMDAGIRPGDVIVGLDRNKSVDQASLIELLSAKKPGDRVTVDLISRGERKTLELELGSSAERDRLIVETDSFFDDSRDPAVRALRDSLAQLRINEEEIEKTVREWQESVAQAEALVREQNGNITRWAFPGQRGPAFTDDDNRFIIRSLPGLTTTPPPAPTPPGLNAEAAERLEDRMQRLEGQMQRLENAIDRLIDAMER